jgi:hypothetical protein
LLVVAPVLHELRRKLYGIPLHVVDPCNGNNSSYSLNTTNYTARSNETNTNTRWSVK